MAKANYLKLDEAAEKLGISADKLKEMIDSNEVRAFRDGTSFKLKTDEVDRIKSTLGDLTDVADETLKSVDDSLDDLVSVDGILDDDDSADSLLVEENAGGNPTVIGETGTPGAGDSDLQLAGDSDLLSGGSDVLGGEPEGSASDTGVLGKSDDIELSLDDDDDDAFELSSEPPAPPTPPPSSDLDLSGDSDLELSASDDGDNMEISLDSDLNLAGGSDLSLSGDSDLELSAGGDDNAIDLDDDDVMLGSGVGSDVTLGGGDSGINLSNPADSGLSLEGAGDAAMSLDDDDMLSLDGDDLDSGPPELKADDDFLLTPVEEEGGDESDSGSQVIALDSEEFDDSAATMLDGDGGFGDALVEEVADPAFDDSAMAAAAPAAAAAMAPAAEEVQFSLGNILALAVLLVLMCMASVMMLDVMKNIWSWDGIGGISSSIMEPLAGLIE